jgi:hypothetical protein
VRISWILSVSMTHGPVTDDTSHHGGTSSRSARSEDPHGVLKTTSTTLVEPAVWRVDGPR